MMFTNEKEATELNLPVCRDYCVFMNLCLQNSLHHQWQKRAWWKRCLKKPIS